ncbi:hypothetical protein [Roseovarius ramblicola]|uniref:PH domain-containing protein n=1 Tax=Roseovarius ramblicola TaxID=2022336 RepID=A0ABV5HZ20_9RHOB
MRDHDDTEPPDTGPRLVLAASPGRRLIGVGSVTVLGGLMLWVTLSQPLAPQWQVAMVAMGAGALWLAWRMWRATSAWLVLERDALMSSDGRVLARMEDVVSVARGAFAFKPSNGFTVTLRDGGPVAWEPGLWWRIGRRVGVGGVTPGSPARLMAELMQERIARRDEG